MSVILAPGVKQQVRAILDQLPDDCTLEDVQYRLYVIQKVSAGLESIQQDGGLSHDDVKARLAKWLTK